MSGTTLLRSYAMYKPLRLFFLVGTILILIGAVPITRFIYFYLNGDGAGHIQSIVLGGTLVLLGAGSILIGMLADLINFNRKLIEITAVKVRNIEMIVENTAKAQPISNKQKQMKNSEYYISATGTDKTCHYQ